MRMDVRAWLVAMCLTASVHAQGAEPAADVAPIEVGPSLSLRGVSIYWENDGERFKPNNPSDRYYTSGVGVSMAVTGEALASLEDKLPFHEAFGKPASLAAGLTVGQLIFTPEDIQTPLPQPDDRPYAGYLYAGLFVQRQGVAGQWAGDAVATLDHFQLDVGVVGPSSLGEDAQIWIHKRINEPEPRGWSNQLRDEPALQLTIRKKWRFDVDRLWRQADASSFGVQAIPEIGGTLGNVHRHIEAGTVLRAGWNLPDDFGPSRLNNLGSATGGNPFQGWSFYGFARVGGRIVEHNLFLEGNTWRDSLSVEAKPFVGELQLGAVLAYHWQNWALAGGYSQTFSTKEFDGQDGTHAWGAYTISLTTWF
jgi:lipid A 3-O-deacylase